MNKGDYVRTKKGTIYQFNSTSSKALNGAKKYMVKSSPNIIDLIEVGDYVNGMKITNIKKDLLGNVEYVFGYSKEGFEGETMYYDEDIKSIVTHEQFSAMEYKVESQE